MGKVASKIFGLYPFNSVFRQERDERWYYTRMMYQLDIRNHLALYGLAHGLVTQEQYSFLVAAVIASAVVPTLIAGLALLPSHLLPKVRQPGRAVRRINGLSVEGSVTEKFELWLERAGRFHPN